jgi:ribosomal protein L29
MERKEIRAKTRVELIKIREKLEKDIQDAYFEMRTGKLEDVRKPRRMRRELAVLNTVIKEKESDKLKDEKNE